MRILLLRHAKSSWDQPGLRDHDRPLAPRGERAAPAMGAYCASTNLRVDRIVSSTANRALSTARLFREAFDPGIQLTSRRDLYHADSRDLLTVAQEEADGNDDARILLVGHNPGIHELAVALSGEGDADQVARLRAKFPTGALAEFELREPRSQSVRPPPPSETGRLLRFIRPKDLPAAEASRL